MAKILFLCEKDVMGSSVTTQIAERFMPTVLQYDFRKINDFLSRHPTDLIIAYMRDITPPSEQVLKDLLENAKKTPFMLIGNEDDCTSYCNAAIAKVVKCIYTPFSVSKFISELAALTSKIDSESTSEDKGPVPKLDGIKKHVLVVDDDAVYLRTMMNWLKKDYNVSVLKSGMDAITFLREETPDLILLDYEMPMWTGIRTLKEIRSDRRGADVPVMFLTGVSSTQVVKEAIALNPQGYILKNISQKGLLEKIKTVI